MAAQTDVQTDIQTDIQERCVVILGKTGTGKSTIANMLVGYDPMSQEDPPFEVSDNLYQTCTRSVKERKSEFKQGNTVYRMRVVDTPGLFDTFGKRTSEAFKELEGYFNDHFIVGVNLILIACRKAVFLPEEKQALSAITGKFGGVCKITAIVITQCEHDNSVGARENVCEIFKNNKDTKEIALQMGKGIYTVGFPPVKQMEESCLESCLETLKKAMKDDTQQLIDLIVNCEEVHLTKTVFQPWTCTIQ